jgi:hypothetical protein
MATMGTASILAKYFNQGAGKRALTDFQKELKELSADEKAELAAGVIALDEAIKQEVGLGGVTEVKNSP